MKRFIILILIMMSVMMACATKEVENNDKEGSEDTKVNEADTSSKEESGKEDSNTFEEVDLIEVEGLGSYYDFNFDQDGDTLHWQEKEEMLTNDIRGKVWLDGGEIVELDMEKFGHGSIITPSGKIVGSESEERIYSINILDPRTGDIQKYTKDDGRNDIMVPAIFNFREAPLAIALNRDYSDGLEYFVWYLESNEIIDIDMTEWIANEIGDIGSLNPNYSTVTISNDGKKVHVAFEEGIFQYDVDSQGFETLLTEEDQAMTLTYTSSDDKNLVYFRDEQDENYNTPILGMDLDTKEKFEIAQGRNLHILEDEKIFYQDQHELYVYDFATRESQLIYTIELEENEELDFVTISRDSNTIAYAYVIDEDEGEKVKIRVLRR